MTAAAQAPTAPSGVATLRRPVPGVAPEARWADSPKAFRYMAPEARTAPPEPDGRRPGESPPAMAPDALRPHPGLPDFVVIGAMRAATTSLHRLLAAHPGIGMSREKETDYFIVERNFDRGLDWYRSLYPSGAQLLGETSPNYTKFDIFPGVPGRMAATLPAARLIYVVRDPVVRALSHYRFAAAMRAGPPDRLALEHILTTSRYASQLEGFLEHYAPERILVVDFDGLVRRTAATMAGIGAFLGLPGEWQVAPPREENAAGELARMPRWFFRIRRIRIVSDLRRRLPAPLADRLRRAMARGPGRQIPPPAEAVIARFRDALAPEATALRAMTGLAFRTWSL